jgi:hypothetical protein
MSELETSPQMEAALGLTRPEPVTDGSQESAAQAAVSTEPPESKTQSILREAIQKVMEEIEFHEKEARKHRQQAEALRKELRESVAFLRLQGEKGMRSDPPQQTGVDKSVERPPAQNRRGAKLRKAKKT